MTYQLTVEPLGETIDIEDGQTVLDACLRHGIYLPYACGHGLCSTCKISVLSGEFDHGDATMFALMDFERDEGKALACCARPSSDLTIEADVEVDPDALCLPIRDVAGTVSAIHDLTPDIKAIHVEVPGEGLSFQAGQYVNMTLPGIDGPRAFSIASSPADPNHLEFQVRLVPGGAATTYLHKTLAIGDTLNLTGPFGRFFVRRSSPSPLIFIAGGSGLSSPKSMILDLLETGWATPIVLFHGVRGPADLYDEELFRGLAEHHPNFTYVPALSANPEGSDWAGETGFIHEVAERHFAGSFKGARAYLCGPPVMIEASIRALMKGRLFEKDIFTERFVTKADGEAALAKSPLFKRI